MIKPIAVFLFLSGFSLIRGEEGTITEISLGDQAYTIGQDCQHGEYNLEFEYPAKTTKPIEAVFCYRDERNYYALSVTSKKMSLKRVLAGQTTEMDSTGTAPFQKLSIQRRRDRLSVLLDSRKGLNCLDGHFHEGQVAMILDAAHRRPSGFRYQPVSKIYFTDDFMRVSDKDSRWTQVKGDWKVASTIDHWSGNSVFDASNFTRSTNPFVFEGSGEDGALALAGRSFWDEYRFGVSIRGKGTFGIAFFVQKESQFYGLRWSLHSVFAEAAPLELFSVNGDQEKIIAQRTITGKANRWNRLEVYAGPDRIRVWLDRAKVLDAPHKDFIGGRVGLYVGKGGQATFDDILVETPVDFEVTESDSLVNGKSVLGKWSIYENKGETGLRCDSSEQSIHLLSSTSWKANCLSASIIPGEREAEAGLVFDWRGQNDFSRVRISRGTILLEETLSGKTTPISLAEDIVLPESGEHEIALDLSDRNLLKLYLNGTLELRQRLRRTANGAGGLTVSRGGGTKFYDIRWRSSLGRDEEQMVRNQIFEKDFYMLEWSAAQGAWAQGGGPPGFRTFWHKGDFYGRFQLDLPLAANGDSNAQIGAIRSVFFKVEENDWRSGYRLDIRPGATAGAINVHLLRRKQEVAAANIKSATEKPGSLQLSLDGKYIVCRFADKDLFAYRDHVPLRGTRMALVTKSFPAFENIKLRRGHVIDDFFTRAPTHWDLVGRWEVTNKFACDPRWSYFAGESDGLASAWHKDEFTGDFTLEYYTGMRFRLKFNLPPYYPRPGDMNAAICADGSDVFSGYTFVLSGWDTTTTRILRKGKIVAETRKPLVPNTRSSYPPLNRLHRRWFYVKIRKRGSRLEYFFDNDLVLSWEDPEPLDGGRAGLWTQNNSIMVARVKMEYEKKIPLTHQMSKAKTESKTSTPHVIITSETHPGLLSTFEKGIDDWTNPSGDQGAKLRSVKRSSQGNCLELVNVNPGGDFTATPPLINLDLAKNVKMKFDYRIGPGVFVNIYLKLNGKWHFIRFTGPELSNENMKYLGGLPKVKASGNWRTASLDLTAAARRLYANDRTLLVTSLQLGLLHRDYMMAGYGGNPAGARFYLDNFQIVSTSGMEMHSSVSISDVSDPLFSSTVSRRSKPPAKSNEPAETPTVHSDRLKNGLWYLHTRARLPDDTWTQFTTMPFEVRGEKTKVNRIRPRPGRKWSGKAVVLTLSDGVPPAEIKLEVAGQTFQPDNDVLVFDPRRQELSFLAHRTRLKFSDGQKVGFKLKIDESEKDWSYTWSVKGDRFPPSRVRLGQLIIDDDFEKSKGEWVRNGDRHGALLIRSRENPANGRYSLKLSNELIGGVFSVTRSFEGGFNAGHFPLLRFKYRIQPQVTIDLGLTAGGVNRRIILTDNNHRNSYQRLGHVRGVKSDGKWRQAEINLREMLSNQQYAANQFSVTQMVFADWGWTGNREGVEYSIDDVQITPVLNPGKGFELSWQASDNSGFDGWSYKWSKSVDEGADTKEETCAATARFEQAPEGLTWFHIRAKDKAGNWGPSTAFKFLIDSKPPVIKGIEPKAGAMSGSGKMVIELDDANGSGIDPSTLTLIINSSELKPGSAGLVYDPTADRLTWDWLNARTKNELLIPEGEKFKIELNSVSDFAGNESQPFKWEWTQRLSMDKTPPQAPKIIVPSNVALAHETFSRSKGRTAPYGGGIRTNLHLDDLTADSCLSVLDYMDGSFSSVYLSKSAYDLSSYPHISFDYRFPKHLKVDLLLKLNETLCIIKLFDTPTKRRFMNIGSVEGVEANGRWHHLSVNVYEIVKKQFPALQTYQMTWVALGNWWWGWRPEGTTYFIDNYTIGGKSGTSFVASFQSFDASGIKGHSTILDQQPFTIPPEKVNTKGANLTIAPPSPGRWHLHVRSCDTAGNWSAVSHMEVVRN